MADMASLKITPKAENEGGCAPCDYEQNPFGWGTRLYLNDEQVKAIFGTALPEAGQTVTITAKAFVSSASMNASVKNGTEKSVELQFTDMSVQPEQGKPAEEVLWGKPA